MNKSELIDQIAARAAVSHKDAARALDAALAAVTDALARGESVTVTGFGTFEVTERAERDGFNPRTRQAIRIAAATAIKFRPAAALKKAVN